MSRQIRGLLYFQTANVKYTFIIFWSILIATAAVSLLISAVTMSGDDSMVIYFGGATYIFAFFIGYQRVKYDVTYAIKLGATRKNIFLSTGIFFLGLSFVCAVLISVIHQLITFITNTFHIDTYTSVHPSSYLDDTWVNRLIIDTSLMFFFLTLLFIFGLLFYHFGLIGGGIVGAAFMIMILGALGTGWLQDVFQSLMDSFSIGFFFNVFLVGIGIYIISWLFLRRITILMKK